MAGHAPLAGRRDLMRAVVALVVALIVWAAGAGSASAAAWPAPADGTYVVPEFRFADGETLKNLRLHYVTLGRAHRDAAGHVDNAVLILHGTGGDTNQFLREQFAGVLFVPGGLLDAAKYFIVITDGIGHGKSSKPSDGLHAKFPHYGYRDMVRAQHDVLVNALHVDHLRLVMGTSMGGMQTWLWGETYPAMMDALMPLASLPIQISGRNRVWRDMIVDDLRNDPGYSRGEYRTQPHGLKAAVDMLWIFGSAPLYNQSQFPTRDQADAYYENTIKPRVANYDANDMIYQFESSRDYNPQPDLGKIVAPLLAINSADDQINPPELRIMESEIVKVRHGRFVLLPISNETRGHGTHTLPSLWWDYLRQVMSTRTDVTLSRTPDGRALLNDFVSIEMPPGWYADTNPEDIEDYRTRLRSSADHAFIDVVVNYGHFSADPPGPANARPYCINGIPGWRAEVSGGRSFGMLSLGPGRSGEGPYAFYSYQTGDTVADGIARSFRAERATKKC